MKRILTLLILLILPLTTITAQSDDDLFGGSDDALFGADDDFFGDDSIDEVPDVVAKSDLSKGVIFDSGSVKVGGSLSAGLSTNTVLYSEEENDFADNLKHTTLTPDLSAMLSVDARPTETLRLYTKFGFAYPFEDKTSIEYQLNQNNGAEPKVTVADWFKLKELFTDFSVNDTAYFRFGIHTVTWGAGYFFSPVSDMINSTSIDPEHPEKQVDGALNLRTQIIIPDSQNCLWFYVIPSTNFKNQTAETYARDTALAGKADILIGNWELGVGGLYKYDSALKAMLTATGSLKKISFFGEFVYSYGAASEWAKNTDWDDKTNIFQATAGFTYYWKEQKINLAAQYLFEGNDKDLEKKITQYGHNVALMASKGELFKNPDLSLSLFAMANIGRKEATTADIIEKYPEAAMFAVAAPAQLEEMAKQASTAMPALTANLTLNYKPFKDMSFGAGPSITFKDFETKPTVSMKLTATLGGGKF